MARPGERMDGHGGGPAVPIAESRKDQRQAPSPERSPTLTGPPPRAGRRRGGGPELEHGRTGTISPSLVPHLQ